MLANLIIAASALLIHTRAHPLPHFKRTDHPWADCVKVDLDEIEKLKPQDFHSLDYDRWEEEEEWDWIDWEKLKLLQKKQTDEKLKEGLLRALRILVVAMMEKTARDYIDEEDEARDKSRNNLDFTPEEIKDDKELEEITEKLTTQQPVYAKRNTTNEKLEETSKEKSIDPDPNLTSKEGIEKQLQVLKINLPQLENGTYHFPESSENMAQSPIEKSEESKREDEEILEENKILKLEKEAAEEVDESRQNKENIHSDRKDDNGSKDLMVTKKESDTFLTKSDNLHRGQKSEGIGIEETDGSEKGEDLEKNEGLSIEDMSEKTPEVKESSLKVDGELAEVLLDSYGEKRSGKGAVELEDSSKEEMSNRTSAVNGTNAQNFTGFEIGTEEAERGETIEVSKEVSAENTFENDESDMRKGELQAGTRIPDEKIFLKSEKMQQKVEEGESKLMENLNYNGLEEANEENVNLNRKYIELMRNDSTVDEISVLTPLPSPRSSSTESTNFNGNKTGTLEERIVDEKQNYTSSNEMDNTRRSTQLNFDVTESSVTTSSLNNENLKNSDNLSNGFFSHQENVSERNNISSTISFIELMQNPANSVADVINANSVLIPNKNIVNELYIDTSTYKTEEITKAFGNYSKFESKNVAEYSTQDSMETGEFKDNGKMISTSYEISTEPSNTMGRVKKILGNEEEPIPETPTTQESTVGSIFVSTIHSSYSHKRNEKSPTHSQKWTTIKENELTPLEESPFTYGVTEVTSNPHILPVNYGQDHQTEDKKGMVLIDKDQSTLTKPFLEENESKTEDGFLEDTISHEKYQDGTTTDSHLQSYNYKYATITTEKTQSTHYDSGHISSGSPLSEEDFHLSSEHPSVEIFHDKIFENKLNKTLIPDAVIISSTPSLDRVKETDSTTEHKDFSFTESLDYKSTIPSSWSTTPERIEAHITPSQSNIFTIKLPTTKSHLQLKPLVHVLGPLMRSAKTKTNNRCVKVPHYESPKFALLNRRRRKSWNGGGKNKRHFS